MSKLANHLTEFVNYIFILYQSLKLEQTAAKRSGLNIERTKSNCSLLYYVNINFYCPVLYVVEEWTVKCDRWIDTIKRRNLNSTFLNAKDSKHICLFLIVTCSFNCQSKSRLKPEAEAHMLLNTKSAFYFHLSIALTWINFDLMLKQPTIDVNFYPLVDV